MCNTAASLPAILGSILGQKLVTEIEKERKDTVVAEKSHILPVHLSCFILDFTFLSLGTRTSRTLYIYIAKNTEILLLLPVFVACCWSCGAVLLKKVVAHPPRDLMHEYKCILISVHGVDCD